jgi:hypothetical protein
MRVSATIIFHELLLGRQRSVRCLRQSAVSSNVVLFQWRLCRGQRGLPRQTSCPIIRWTFCTRRKRAALLQLNFTILDKLKDSREIESSRSTSTSIHLEIRFKATKHYFLIASYTAYVLTDTSGRRSGPVWVTCASSASASACVHIRDSSVYRRYSGANLGSFSSLVIRASCSSAHSVTSATAF